MNDYKELIGDIGDCLIAHPSETLCKRILREAADAIGQLVSDYEILAKMYAKVNEELCVRTKERDAAVADLYELFTKDESPCAFCVAEHCDKCIINYPYWEWRGVRSEENVR